MTYPVPDYPWLWQWWRLQHDARSASEPLCVICAREGDLVLVDRATGAEMTTFDDLSPACPRCADRVEQLVADRIAPSQPWAGMPRIVAVPAIIRELATGRTPIESTDDDPIPEPEDRDPAW